ncbi:Putative lipoprotein NMB1124/NMB1162 precursor [Chromobacterium violaceum]|nr:Putative lipoprotein NMB1124/NMB1162 precursor [Chromobacterium violaceum]
MTYPLAEAGYYVVPVALMTETFKQNGLATANDIQAVSPAKLREIFGADAALYTTIKRYGVRYSVIDSVAEVEVSTKLVDLKNGQELWAGSAAANNANNNNNNVGGLVGMLVNAAIKQIVNSATDATYPVAGMASNMLLSAGRVNGVLYGPRSPQYGTD